MIWCTTSSSAVFCENFHLVLCVVDFLKKKAIRYWLYYWKPSSVTDCHPKMAAT